MGVKDAILRKILGLAETEGVETGEKSLARNMAEKAAIEGSETEANQVSKDLLNNQLAQENYEQFSRPQRMTSMDEVNKANDGFTNPPKVTGELPPVGSALETMPPRSPADQSAEVFERAGLTPQEKLQVLRGKPQNMTPMKSEAPSINEGSLGDLPSPNDASTPVNPMIAGASAAGLLGLGAALPKAQKPPSDIDMGNGGLFNLPGFPSKEDRKFGPQDLLMDQPQEEQPEDTEDIQQGSAQVGGNAVPKGAPVKRETSEKAKPEQKSDIQSLADMLQAQDESGESFKDAQNRKNLSILGNQLGSAGDIIGGAISHTGPNEAVQKAFGNNVKLAENITNDFKDRKVMEEQDPNSAVSKNYRDFLTKYGVKAGPGVTAAQIKNVLLPAAEKEQLKKSQLDAQKFTAEQGRLSRESIADENRKSREFIAQQNLEGRKALAATTTDKQATNLAKRQLEMAKNRALSGGGIAANRVRNRITAADNIFGTIGVDTELNEHDIDKLDQKMLNKIPLPMVAEMAVEMNAMLTPSGIPPQSTFKKLLPANLAMDKAKIAGYITSSLPPAQQEEFVKLTLKTAARIKRNSQKQNAKLMGQYFSGTSHIRDHLPDDYNEAVKSLGLNPDDLMAGGGPKKAAAPGYVPMTKDGINYKPIPADQVEEAKTHGYKE